MDNLPVLEPKVISRRAASMIGNQNGRRGKVWRDALRKAAYTRLPDGTRALDHVARKLMQMALDGDINAIKELANRIDGLPISQVDVGGTGAPIILSVVPTDSEVL